MPEKATERRPPPFVSMSRLLDFLPSPDQLPSSGRRLITVVTTPFRLPLTALTVLVKGFFAISFLLAVSLLLVRTGARLLRSRATGTDDDDAANLAMTAEAQAKARADAVRRELEMLDPEVLEARTCPICQEPTGLPNAEGVVEGWSTLPCGHKFGSYCIKHYLRVVADDRPSCPVCRNMAYHKCGHPALPTVIKADPSDMARVQEEMNKIIMPHVSPLDRGLAFGRGGHNPADVIGKAGEAVASVEQPLSPTPSQILSGAASPALSLTPPTATVVAQRGVDMMKHSECAYCVERQAEKVRLRLAARAQARTDRADRASNNNKDGIAITGTKGVSARYRKALGWFRSLTWRVKKIARTTSAEIAKPRNPSNAGSSSSDSSSSHASASSASRHRRRGAGSSTASDEGSEAGSSTSVSEAESETNDSGDGRHDATDEGEQDANDDYESEVEEVEEEEEEVEEVEEVRMPGRLGRPRRADGGWAGPWIDPFPRQRDAEWESWWVKQEPIERTGEVGSVQA